MTELDTLRTNLYFWRNKRSLANDCVKNIEEQIAKLTKLDTTIKLTVSQRKLMWHIKEGKVTYWTLERGEQRIALTLSHKKLIHEDNVNNMTILQLTEQGQAALDLYK